MVRRRLAQPQRIVGRPATGRVLQHPGVVERARFGIEVGIAPDATESLGARTAGVTGRELDRSAVVLVARHVHHLLVEGIQKNIENLENQENLENLENLKNQEN